MKNRSFSNYWKELRPLWWRELKLWIPFGSWGQIVTGLITNIVPVTIIFLIDNNAERFASEVIANTLAWTVLIIWLLFVSTITYIRTSVNLYQKQKDIQYKQQEEIKELNKESESLPEIKVDVKKYAHPRHKKVGITLHNRESKDISIYIKPTSLKRFDSDESYGWTQEPTTTFTFQINDRFNLGENSIVEVDDTKSFTFAETQNNEVVFLFGDKSYVSKHTYYHHAYLRTSTYKVYEIKWELEFEIHGKINGKAFRKLKFKTEINSTRNVPVKEWNRPVDLKFDTVTIEIGEVTKSQAN